MARRSAGSCRSSKSPLASAALLALLLGAVQPPRSFSAPGASRRAVLGLAVGAAAGAPRAEAIVDAGGEYAAIAEVQVVDSSGAVASLADVVGSGPGKTVLALLTHFGDFNAWEYAQQLKFQLPALQQAGAQVVLVGIGGASQARRFAELLELPASMRLYADQSGSAAIALGCSQGFAAGAQVSGYLKLLPMLAGLGSPGTLQAVLRGYVGDPAASHGWVDASLAQGSAQGRFPTGLGAKDWDYLGAEGLRPLELATLRLQNMVDGIVAHWSELAPSDDQLVVQQGGTVVLDGRRPIYTYRDDGILTYTPVERVLEAVRAS